MGDNEHLRMRFELGRHGWSDLHLEKGNISRVIRITHIFDDDPTESLIQFAEDIQNQKYPARTVFQDEPGTHILELSVVVDGAPELKLFSSSENFQSIEKMEEVETFEVTPSFIATQIFAELCRTEVLMGHKIYQKDRTQFPFKHFKEMKSKFSSY